MGTRTCRNHRIRAFTLTEVLIAQLVMGIVAVGLYTGISFAFTLTRATEDLGRAADILEGKIETLRLYTWQQITNPSYIPRTFELGWDGATNSSTPFFHGIIDVREPAISETYKPYVREIIVTLSWTNGIIRRSRQMQTFISQYGNQK